MASIDIIADQIGHDRGVVLYAAGAPSPVTVKDRNGITLSPQALGTTERLSADINGDGGGKTRSRDLVISIVGSTTAPTGNLTIGLRRRRRDANNPTLWGGSAGYDALITSLNGTSATTHTIVPTATISATLRMVNADHVLAGEVVAFVVAANAAAAGDWIAFAADVG